MTSPRLARAGPRVPAGIIAAGDGARLKSAFPGAPKPLVPVAGRPLVHWTAAALHEAGASPLVILLNSRGRRVRASLGAAFPDAAWTFLEADTPSSWESFRVVCAELARSAEAAAPRNRAPAGPELLVSTVDAVVHPSQVSSFIAHARSLPAAEAALGLTSLVDDEKPLWAAVDARGFVTALGDGVRPRRRATCGLYAVSRSLAATLGGRRTHPNLRSFLSWLVESGCPVAGIDIGPAIDVDRPGDVPAAEAFLRAGPPPECSPGPRRPPSGAATARRGA